MRNVKQTYGHKYYRLLKSQFKGDKNLVRYIIEKTIHGEYAQGVEILMDGDKPRTFSSEAEARRWLMDNDEDFNRIPITQLIDHYNIKPYVI